MAEIKFGAWVEHNDGTKVIRSFWSEEDFLSLLEELMRGGSSLEGALHQLKQMFVSHLAKHGA